VAQNLEELYLAENSMKKEDVDILAPVIASLPKLRVLWLAKNPIDGSCIRKFLDAYINNEAYN